jgi:hypothetical protein
MHLPSEFPAEQSTGFRPGFVERVRNRSAACFRAATSVIHFGGLSAYSRLLLVSVILAGIAGGGILVYCFGSRVGASPDAGQESPYWDRISHVDLKNLVTVGKNPYFNLEPGYRLRYSSSAATRTMTVRRKTKVIEGVETRLVEEKEEEHGRPTKIVWRYYAIDKTTSALYCFGVHTQTYYKGRLVGHRSWRSGSHGAMFTLVLPAAPQVGDTLLRNRRPPNPRRQEEVIEVGQKVVTPAGTFANCVCTETKGRGESKVKVFAPGVGLVQDGQFALVKVVQTVPKSKDQNIRNTEKRL